MCFSFHKTTRRAVYERARAASAGRETSSFSRMQPERSPKATDFNLVVEIEGARVTPPISCGLLPGTMRAEMLDRGEIIERVITVDALRRAGGGWLINSVRGSVPFVLRP